MPVQTSPSILCIWCNRVMEWGQRGVSYDLCEGCEPSAINAMAICEVDTRGQVIPFRARAVRAVAALG